jgi:mono/diheme cytochrome c family protein
MLKMGWMFILLAVLAACGTVAVPVWQSPPTAVVRIATRPPLTPTVIPTASPFPTATFPLTATSSAPVPTATETASPKITPVLRLVTATPNALASGDPVRGQELFNTFQSAASFACATCHRVDSEERLIGPGLLNIGARAETRVEGMEARDYIYTSIINPSAFVVPDFPDGLMPKNWAEIYSEDDIDDIISYLMSLRSG